MCRQLCVLNTKGNLQKKSVNKIARRAPCTNRKTISILKIQRMTVAQKIIRNVKEMKWIKTRHK